MSKERIRPDSFRIIQNKAVNFDASRILSEEQKNELLALYEGAIASFQQGKLTKGKIITIDNDGILVDIQYKSRGLVPRHEFSPHELKKLQPGDEIEVIIEKMEGADGVVLLSYEKAKSIRVWNEIMRLYEEGKPIEGTVVGKVKGGLNVDIGGVLAFLPGSQIDLQRVVDFDQYVGQPITAVILKINRRRGNVIISRRKYLHDLRSEERHKILDTLKEGQVIRGIVKNITNYGVFIDIGGIDGLLHITDMTWGRIAHPSELVKIGDTVTVKVLSFDKASEKISLGMKQLLENPWTDVDKTLKVGSRVKGKITSVTDYGIFVEVAPHAEGLVHISEVSWTDRISNLANRFKVGDEIEVLVVSLDKENRRMSLSIKQLERNPWDLVEEQFAIGQRVRGKISNITDFGIFVTLASGIDGLVHVSDLSWTEHIEDPSKLYSVGQEIEAVVLGIDKANKKISLGIKQLTENPWGHIHELFKIGDIVSGDVAKVTTFGAFVRLRPGVEGLLHNSTLTQEVGKKAEELYSIGQAVTLRVTNISSEEQRIGLSTVLLPTGEESSATAPQQSTKSSKKGTRAETKAAAPQPQQRAKGSLQKALESALGDNEQEEDKE